MSLSNPDDFDKEVKKNKDKTADEILEEEIWGGAKEAQYTTTIHLSNSLYNYLNDTARDYNTSIKRLANGLLRYSITRVYYVIKSSSIMLEMANYAKKHGNKHEVAELDKMIDRVLDKSYNLTYSFESGRRQMRVSVTHDWIPKMITGECRDIGLIEDSFIRFLFTNALSELEEVGEGEAKILQEKIQGFYKDIYNIRDEIFVPAISGTKILAEIIKQDNKIRNKLKRKLSTLFRYDEESTRQLCKSLDISEEELGGE